MNTRFQEYATRTAFMLTLTKNQIACLQYVLEYCEFWRLHGVESKPEERQFKSPSPFIVGIRKLQAIGLMDWHDPGLMEPKWSKPVWTLTKAGEAACVLLIEAGLLQKPKFVKVAA